MRTILPDNIKTELEAKRFLHSLAENNELYHPEDDAHSIIWQDKQSFEELEKLNKLMSDMHNLNNFDPCEYILDHIIFFS